MWVSADIAKGGRERVVPVIADLVPVVAEIRANVADDEYVLPAQRFRNPPFNTERLDLRRQPSSSQALRAAGDACRRVGLASRRTSLLTISGTRTPSTSRGRPTRASHSTFSVTLTSARPTPIWVGRGSMTWWLR